MLSELCWAEHCIGYAWSLKHSCFHSKNAAAAYRMLPQLGSSVQLGWNLVSVTVKTTKDLQAMRKALGGIVEYLEADLTAFCTFRTFNDDVLNGRGFDIPAQPYPVDVLVPPALRLLAEIDPPSDSEQQFELRWTEPVPVVPDEGPIHGVVCRSTTSYGSYLSVGCGVGLLTQIRNLLLHRDVEWLSHTLHLALMPQ